MKHKDDSRMYKADDGKLIVRKSDGKIMGDGLYLGIDDSIDNYEERELTEDEIDEFWKKTEDHLEKLNNLLLKRTIGDLNHEQI